MFKKHMSALSKGGQKVNNAGKGSQQAPMAQRSQIQGMATSPGPSMNDYAKASPAGMPSPGASPGGTPAASGGPPGLGSGNWAGIGG
jgi:hypothetical protein